MMRAHVQVHAASHRASRSVAPFTSQPTGVRRSQAIAIPLMSDKPSASSIITRCATAPTPVEGVMAADTHTRRHASSARSPHCHNKITVTQQGALMASSCEALVTPCAAGPQHPWRPHLARSRAPAPPPHLPAPCQVRQCGTRKGRCNHNPPVRLLGTDACLAPSYTQRPLAPSAPSSLSQTRPTLICSSR